MATPVLSGISGFWRALRGDAVAQAIANQLMNYYSGLVGSATNTAAGGTKMALGINEFDTVASSSAATLPGTIPGSQVVIINNGAQTLTIYPLESTSTINAGGAGASYSLASGKTCHALCAKPGKWFVNLSA